MHSAKSETELFLVVNMDSHHFGFPKDKFDLMILSALLRSVTIIPKSRLSEPWA